MVSTRHHVTFRFKLPGSLAMRAHPGFWPRSPRGVTLDVGDGGNVLVTSVDLSERYARKQVLETAAHFLRAVDDLSGPRTFCGELSAPSNRDRPEIYSIALGASVSIARAGADRSPVTVLGPEQLDLLNHASG